MVLTMLVGLLPAGSVSVHAAEPVADDGNTATVATTVEPAPAANAETLAGGLSVDGGTSGADYSYADGTLTILTSMPLTISGTTTSDHIVVGSGVEANLTLAGVTISTGASPIDVPAGASLTLTLAAGSENTLTATGAGHAGIHVPKESTLTIACAAHESDCPGEENCGSLMAQGGNYTHFAYGAGAGIGGNGGMYVSADDYRFELPKGEAAGTMNVTGGQVTATGGSGTAYGCAAAGIGGGGGHNNLGGAGGTVTISGGLVTAKGYIYRDNNGSQGIEHGGIGGGQGYNFALANYADGDGGSLTLSGGTLENVSTSPSGSFTMNGGTLQGCNIYSGTQSVSGGTLSQSSFRGITTWNDGDVSSVSNCTLNFTAPVTVGRGGTDNTYSGESMTINQEATFSGTTTFANALTIQAPVTLSGTTTMQRAVTIDNGGSLTNNDTLTIEAGSTVNNGGSFTNAENATVHLYGTIDNASAPTGTITNNGTLYIYEGGRILNNNQPVGPNTPIESSSQPVPAGEVVIDLSAASGQQIVIGANSYTIGEGTPQPYDPAKNNIVLTGVWSGKVGKEQSAVTLAAGLTSTVILRDATFNVEATDFGDNEYGRAVAIQLSDNCKTTLLLEGTNTVTPCNNTASTDNRSVAIRTAPTSSLTIDGDGTLNLNYDGSSWRFGIGNVEGNMGTITLNGGHFTVTVDSSKWYLGGGSGLFYGHGGGELVINDGSISGNLCLPTGNVDGNTQGLRIVVNGGTIREDGSLQIQTDFSSSNNNFTINGGSVHLTSIKGNSLTVNGGELVTDVYCTNDNGFVINGGVVTIEGTRTSTGDDYREPKTITGGSVKMIYSEGSKKEELTNVDDYYLTKLENQSNVTSVLVDGVNQNIAANHSVDDSTLYLYLQHDTNAAEPETHTIVTLCGNTQNTYTTTWEDSGFVVNESSSGTVQEPTETKLTMEVSGAEKDEATGTLQKPVGTNAPLLLTIDLSQVNSSQSATNGILDRPLAQNSAPSYALNTVILYCNGEEIDRQTVRNGQQQVTFSVQTETWLPDDYVFTASYAAYGSGSTQLALSAATTVTIVPASLENAMVGDDLKVSGTYGTKVSDLTIGGGSVTLKDGTAVAGTWSVSDEDADKILDVGTQETVSLTFTPSNQRYASITKTVTPTIRKAAALTPKDDSLSVKNDQAETYTVNLSKLLPTPETGKTLGTVSYTLDKVSLNDGYYTDGSATISGSTLTIPINRVRTQDTGTIGTITVTITSTNYKDMTATINVTAVNKDTQTQPGENEGYTIDFVNETMTATSGYELATDDTALDGSAALDITPGDTVYVRRAGTSTQQPSDWAAVTLPARPAAPEDVCGGTNQISGVNSSMEYRSEGGSWRSISGTRVENLSAGSYEVRYAATENAFASESVQVTVSNYTGKYSFEIFTDVGENGTIDVDRYATEGERVTITVSPDEAYLLDELTVTSGGKDVELTDHGDGTYSFTMPSGDVAITATFAEDPNWSEPEEPATDVSEIFTDVPADHWARAVIQYVYDNGLMTGTSATTFAPEATTTRGMIVSMLARLEGVTSAEPAGFTDVSADDWYATAVNWAASAGIVNGYEDNTFQPNAAITREQLAAMLMNYAQWKGQDTSARADLSHYSDADSISSWANDVLSWAVAEGLLTGVTDDTIAPQVHATRAQVAAILQRFLSE